MKQDIEFKSKGMTCRGWLVTPDAGKLPFPCVVMAMGATYVKEFPIIKEHMEEFKRRGLASIVFDYRCFGASEGLPRQHLDPQEQVEDCRNAISLAETLPDLDPERLGFWGISSGGGYAFTVPALDSRVTCSTAVLPMVDGYACQRLIRSEVDFRKLSEVILEERRKRFKDDTQRGYVAMFSSGGEKELAGFPLASNYEVFMDYKKVAPAWENRRTIESLECYLNYNVWPYLPRILSIPLLAIVIEGDTNTPWNLAIEAYNRVPSPHKSIFLVPSHCGKVTHMSVYSDPSHMQMIAKAAGDFFAEHLI